MPIYSFKEFIPVVDPSSFVHPTASVIGNVIIGKKVYIGPNAVLRGDWGLIRIDDGSNIQENCVIHMFPGTTVHLMENSHIGHGAHTSTPVHRYTDIQIQIHTLTHTHTHTLKKPVKSKLKSDCKIKYIILKVTCKSTF